MQLFGTVAAAPAAPAAAAAKQTAQYIPSQYNTPVFTPCFIGYANGYCCMVNCMQEVLKLLLL